MMPIESPSKKTHKPGLSAWWSDFQPKLVGLSTVLLLSSFILFLWAVPFYPPDDLMRHVVAHAWGYSYHAMYPLSDLPEYNYYPLYDGLAGWIARSTSPYVAVRILSMGCAMTMVWTVYAGVCREGRTQSARPVDALLLTLVLLGSQLLPRAVLGRPESWMLSWAIWATLMRPEGRKTTAAILIMGAVGTMSYWLAFVTFPFLLLSKLSWRQKLIAFGSLCLFHAVFWLAWTDGAALQWPAMIRAWEGNRPFPIMEGMPILVYLTEYAMLLPALIAGICLIFIGTWRAGASNLRWLVALPYLSMNVNRLIPTALLCLIPQALRGLRRLRLPVSFSLVLAWITWAWVFNDFTNVTAGVQPPTFTLPAGSRVLTGFDAATFSLPTANPGRIEVLPPMEIGAGQRSVLQQVVELRLGTPDCEQLHALKVTHAVENYRTSVPGCFNLLVNRGGWRLWGIGTPIASAVSPSARPGNGR